MNATVVKYLKVFDVGAQNTFVYRWNFLLQAGWHCCRMQWHSPLAIQTALFKAFWKWPTTPAGWD